MKVEYLDHMGSDKTVVNAARVSFNREAELGATLTPADCRLIKFLARGLTQEEYLHNLDLIRSCETIEEAAFIFDSLTRIDKHWSPFAHPQVQLRISAPIFVIRQLLRSEVGRVVNEVSRRYVHTPPEVFAPRDLRMRPEGSIKQGSSSETIFIGDIEFEEFDGVYCHPGIVQSLCIEAYGEMIEAGVAPEVARGFLPQNTYTTVIITGSLLYWWRVYNQRSDSHAQKEIQDIAVGIRTVMSALFPESWKALSGEGPIDD